MSHCNYFSSFHYSSFPPILLLPPTLLLLLPPPTLLPPPSLLLLLLLLSSSASSSPAPPPPLRSCNCAVVCRRPEKLPAQVRTSFIFRATALATGRAVQVSKGVRHRRWPVFSLSGLVQRRFHRSACSGFFCYDRPSKESSKILFIEKKQGRTGLAEMVTRKSRTPNNVT